MKKNKDTKPAFDWAVLKPKFVYKKLGELDPYKNNPRVNTASIPLVMNSIRAFGFLVPMVIESVDRPVLVAGHTRRAAAIKLAEQDRRDPDEIDVPCILAEHLTEEQIAAFRIADNSVGAKSVWDEDKLAQEIAAIGDAFDMEADFGVDMSLFDDDEDETEGETDENDVPETPEVPVSKTGEIYKLGDHLLLCGDSTNELDVQQLIGHCEADILLTDPPYNVAYEGSNGLTIKNDSMEDSKFREFLKSAFACAEKSMKHGASFYIFHADLEGYNFRGACQDVGLRVRECLIWKKNALVLGRNDYHWIHEPCLYGWKEGAAHAWYGDRAQTTVMEFNKPKKNDVHPTMKPTDLLCYILKNSTKKGDIVLDTFGGSGSTLIACEQLGRKCRMMELDPKYCDVIRKRWAEFVHGKDCDWKSLTPEAE